MKREPSASAALYPHLPSQSADVTKRDDRKQTLGGAMWPSLSPEVKAADEKRRRNRQRLLKALDELNAKIDARLQREGRR